MRSLYTYSLGFLDHVRRLSELAKIHEHRLKLSYFHRHLYHPGLFVRPVVSSGVCDTEPLSRSYFPSSILIMLRQNAFKNVSRSCTFWSGVVWRSEEHTSELQSQSNLV